MQANQYVLASIKDSKIIFESHTDLYTSLLQLNTASQRCKDGNRIVRDMTYRYS